MKVVIAPDSFKGSLRAAAVAEAIAPGVLDVAPDARIDLCPMADGGEGTVEAIVAATAGEIRAADVFGPLGEPIRAKFGLIGPGGGAGLPGEVGLAAAAGLSSGRGSAAKAEGRTVAVVEMAAASGLTLVPPEMRDPLRTTTFGTGQLIMAALDAGAGQIIVGLGGSATVDGGCGAAQALGVTFTDADGRACVCGLAGGGLADVRGIDLAERDPRVAQVSILAACDVTNPLTGPSGAATIYSPQKGATPEVAARLERNLQHLAEVIREQLGVEVADLPGAGAAGGLGAGLVAFAGAKLADGVEIVAETVQLPRRLAGADLCITGEGRLDAQSLSGKATVGVAKTARLGQVPVVCIPAQADGDWSGGPFMDVRPLVAEGVKPSQALARPEAFLRQRAAEAVKDFLAR